MESWRLHNPHKRSKTVRLPTRSRSRSRHRRRSRPRSPPKLHGSRSPRARTVRLVSRSPSPFSHIYPSTSTKAPEPFRYSPKRSQTSYYPRRRSRSRPSSSRRSNTPKASSRKSNSPYRSRQHSERNPSKPFQSSPKYKSDRQRHKSGSGSNKHVTRYPSPVRGSASSSPSPPPLQTKRRGVTVAATARTRRSTSRQKSPIPKRLRSKSPLFTATKPSSSSSRHYNDITDVARGMRRATTHAPMGISRKSYVRDHEDIPAPKNVEVITIKDKKKKKRTKDDKGEEKKKKESKKKRSLSPGSPSGKKKKKRKSSDEKKKGHEEWDNLVEVIHPVEPYYSPRDPGPSKYDNYLLCRICLTYFPDDQKMKNQHLSRHPEQAFCVKVPTDTWVYTIHEAVQKLANMNFSKEELREKVRQMNLIEYPSLLYGFSCAKCRLTDGQPSSSIDFSDNNNFIKHAKKCCEPGQEEEVRISWCRGCHVRFASSRDLEIHIQKQKTKGRCFLDKESIEHIYANKDVGNDEARPSQQAAALFIKQEKDMVQKQIFLPYPVPGNDAVPPPGIDAVPPPSIDALPAPVFHLPPGVIVPTLDGPSYTDITRSSSIYRENSFNVYDDMVQTYENTTQESESSQVTNHSQVSTASSSNWEDDMQQLIENVNKKVPLQPQQHQQPGQPNLQRQGQSNLQHHQEQDSPLFGKPLPCQNRGRRLSEPTPTQENIPFLVGMMPPSSPDPLGFKPIRIKLPDHMKKENSGGSADSYPESNQQVLYGQSMPHSYDRYETTSHSSHNRDYPTSHRWEDKSQIFNYERSQSWDDTSNSNYQAKHTDKEPRQPIISRHDPRNKSLPNPDERRISELRKSREELFTDDHNHVASDVRDYRYDHGKAAPRAYDRLVATAGPPAYDRGQNDEAVSSSSTKHQPRQEIRSSGEGLDIEAATELDEGEGGIDVLEEADPESCRFQHCPWNGEHVQTCPKLAISQKCGKGLCGVSDRHQTLGFKQNRFLPPNKRDNKTNMCPKLSFYVNHSLIASTRDPRRVDRGVVMVPLHATAKLQDPRKRTGMVYPSLRKSQKIIKDPATNRKYILATWDLPPPTWQT